MTHKGARRVAYSPGRDSSRLPSAPTFSSKGGVYRGKCSSISDLPLHELGGGELTILHWLKSSSGMGVRYSQFSTECSKGLVSTANAEIPDTYTKRYQHSAQQLGLKLLRPIRFRNRLEELWVKDTSARVCAQPAHHESHSQFHLHC